MSEPAKNGADKAKAVFARLPVDEAEWLAGAAEMSDLSVSQIIRRVVRDMRDGGYRPQWLKVPEAE